LSLDPLSLISNMFSEKLGPLLERLISGIETQIDRQQKPFIFLKSNNNILSSNVSDGTLILSGPLIRLGEKGIVEDFNINFTRSWNHKISHC